MMPENQQAPRRVSTQAASTERSSSSLDAEAIRRAIERSQEFEFGPDPAPVQKAAPARPAAAARPQSGARRSAPVQRSAPARSPAPAPGPAPAQRTAAAQRAKEDTAPLIPTVRMFYDQDNDPDFSPRSAKPQQGRAGKKRKGSARSQNAFLAALPVLLSALLLAGSMVTVGLYLAH